MKERYRDLDIVKGIAMLTVLLNHSFILVPINIHDRPWSIYCQDINATFFVCSFFVVSGYLFNSPSNKSFSISNYWRKIKRLLIPYLSYAFLNFSVKLIAPSLVNRPIYSVVDYFKNVLFYGGELWFLYVLFIIITIALIIIPLSPQKAIPWITIGLFGIDLFVNGRETDGLFLWPQVVHFSVFFLCGYLLRDINRLREFIGSKKSLIISSSLFFVFCVILIGYIRHFLFGWPFMCFIGCWFIWSLACALTSFNKSANAFEYVGKNSLGYYWLNGYILVVARTFVVSIAGINLGPVVVITIFALCVIIETLLIFIIKRIPKVGVLIGV